MPGKWSLKIVMKELYVQLFHFNVPIEDIVWEEGDVFCDSAMEK